MEVVLFYVIGVYLIIGLTIYGISMHILIKNKYPFDGYAELWDIFTDCLLCWPKFMRD